MNANLSRHSRYGLTAILLVLSGSGTSAPLSLAEKPLITASGVKPNIMLIIDDSGSMDGELLFPTNDGAMWWHANDKSFVGRDRNDSLTSAGILNFNSAGSSGSVWKKYVYLFPNGTTSGSRVYADSTNDHFAVPPTGPFAFARSTDYNGMYYDPAQDYAPWVSNGTYTFTDMDPASAVSDPVRIGASLDLANDKESDASNWVFRFYDGMVIPAGTHYKNWDTGNWETAASDRTVSGDPRNVGVRYYPATYYSRVTTGTYTVTAGAGTESGSCASPNPAHYVAYALAPSSLVSDEADALAPDGACLKKYEIKDGNTFPSGRTYAAELQNFANWYSYYRKRHIALRGGAGKSFEEIGGVRTGGFRINNRSLQGMWDIDTERSSLYSFLYTAVGSGGTPNREALNYAGQQYDTNSNVITHSCQQNFTLLFTDGFSNVSNVGVGNTDGDKGSPYADTYSNTMADIAMRYYATPLRSTDFPPDTSAGVPTPAGCGHDDTPAWLDCNSKLHMVTYGITLGARGHLFGVSYFDVQDAYATPPAWADPTLTRNPVQVDDLYHAAVNGRGEMLNAGNASELQGALSTALSSIIARTQGSSASATANTGFVGSGTKVYQARFNSSDWSGQLLAFGVDSDTDSATYGMLLTNGPGPDGSLWNAATLIPAADSRNIFTRSTGGGVPFRWNQLSTAQQAALGNSESVLNYIRGSDAGEVRNGGTYRNRATKLGDIVNSAPTYVGAPAFRYLDGLESQPYSAYKIAQANRTKMIYVGANDGMLHGFNADTGAEVMAYVPGRVYGNLAALTNVNYGHKYYADGSPTVIDAFVGGQWRTVLVAGLNRGGQGIYALDVSNPANFTESASNATALSLWEFTDANDADLGYTYSQPAIVKLQTGQWAAIFGNGYNNTEADGSASTTGRAVLYVVNLADGSVIKKIDTEVGTAQDPTGASRPNGLASVVAVDRDGDFMVDAVYGGDLFGNLWKFDLNSSNASQWGVAYRSGNTPVPLFKACAGTSCTTTNRQPITAAPSVGRHPNGRGTLVYFGTGKHLETTDNNGAAGGRQSFYAIWDDGATVSGRSALLSQSITHEIAAGATGNPFNFDVRVTTNTAINWSSHKGWYVDLVSPGDVEQGERQVTAPILRNNRIIFTTTIPSDDPCLPGGKSWLMEMDATSGSRLTFSPFDLNGDRQFSSADFVTITVDGQEVAIPVSGIRMAGGGAATPNVMATEDGETKCVSSLAGMECVRENPGPRERDRQSWRELGL